MRRYLHVGLHKTASTFLQHSIFPCIVNVNYYGGGDIASLHRTNFHISGSSAGALWSTEAALGWPYRPERPRVDTLIAVCRDMSITDVLIVQRDFPSWVKSLWFQTLNEGGVLAFEDWWMASREILDEWRRIFTVLQQACMDADVSLKVLQFDDLSKDEDFFLCQLEEFFGSEIKISRRDGSLVKANPSLYGVNALRGYLFLNRLNRYCVRSALLKSLLSRLQLSPRSLIQRGSLGRILNKASPSTVSLPGDLKYLDWV
jgi:hypothetical protein